MFSTRWSFLKANRNWRRSERNVYEEQTQTVLTNVVSRSWLKVIQLTYILCKWIVQHFRVIEIPTFSSAGHCELLFFFSLTVKILLILSWKLYEMEISYQELSSALFVSRCKYLMMYQHISWSLLATYTYIWLVRVANTVRLQIKNE